MSGFFPPLEMITNPGSHRVSLESIKVLCVNIQKEEGKGISSNRTAPGGSGQSPQCRELAFLIVSTSAQWFC